LSPRALSASLLLALCLGCGDSLEGFRQPTLEQRLASGKVIKVTSCILVWGVEHGERHANQDSFALEYVTSISPSATQELDGEALEVFELIRPISEQWGFSTASVAAFTSVERTGKYDVFNFSRSSDGRWSFSRTSAKVFNTESGRK
jgi:hypothetical protein